MVAPAEVPPITPPRAEHVAQGGLRTRAQVGVGQPPLAAAREPDPARVAQRRHEGLGVGDPAVARVDHLDVARPRVREVAEVARVVGEVVALTRGGDDDQAGLGTAREVEEPLQDRLALQPAPDDDQRALGRADLGWSNGRRRRRRRQRGRDCAKAGPARKAASDTVSRSFMRGAYVRSPAAGSAVRGLAREHGACGRSAAASPPPPRAFTSATPFVSRRVWTCTPARCYLFLGAARRPGRDQSVPAGSRPRGAPSGRNRSSSVSASK